MYAREVAKRNAMVYTDVTVDGLTTKDVEMQFNLSRDYELRSPVCGAGTQRPNPFCRGSR
jgi:hypothetical protein